MRPGPTCSSWRRCGRPVAPRGGGGAGGGGRGGGGGGGRRRLGGVRRVGHALRRDPLAWACDVVGRDGRDGPRGRRRGQARGGWVPGAGVARGRVAAGRRDRACDER